LSEEEFFWWCYGLEEDEEKDGYVFLEAASCFESEM
jgi:hypothetical protein